MNADTVLSEYFEGNDEDVTSSDESDEQSLRLDSSSDDNNSSDDEADVIEALRLESMLISSSPIQDAVLLPAPHPVSQSLTSNASRLSRRNSLPASIVEYSLSRSVLISLSPTSINTTSRLNQPIRAKKIHYGKDNTPWNMAAPLTALLPEVVDFDPQFTQATQELESIMSIFEYFFDDNMYRKIIRYTNQRLNPTEENITIEELKGFVGLLILFGVTNKNDVDADNIWCPTSPDHSAFATACMSRSRFRFISTSISFDDFNSRVSRKQEDPKFHKMRELLNDFKKKIREGLIPGSRVCVDEQLYAYRGRCGFRQYMPSKPNKYGIKFWLLVCIYSGYLFDADVYLGNLKINGSV